MSDIVGAGGQVRAQDERAGAGGYGIRPCGDGGRGDGDGDRARAGGAAHRAGRRAGPIYRPSGRAAEYGEYACNIYTGCSHGCEYCYVPAVLRMSREEFHGDVQPREGIAEAVKKQLASEKIRNKTIHLCFACDPYPVGVDTTPTREVIEAIKESGNRVQILTKGGYRAACDFDLFDCNDWFGVTISGYDSAPEPRAAAWEERLSALQMARRRGIRTWISCEPVLRPADVLDLIERADFVDLFAIGKLNHAKSDVDWGEFGRRAEWLCRVLGRRYYIKSDLRREMERAAGVMGRSGERSSSSPSSPRCSASAGPRGACLTN